MPQMIKLNNGELLRINPGNRCKLEFSRNNGVCWVVRMQYPGYGDFLDITDTGTELIATTTKGLYYSRNNGVNWIFRHRL